MYLAHKCRCTPCRKAKSEQHLSLTTSDHNVSGKKAQKKITELYAAGFTSAQIAQAATISRATVVNAHSGRKPMIRKSVEKLILGVKFSDLASAPISGKNAVVVGALQVAQIQELYSIGWSASDISELSGISSKTIRHLLNVGRMTAGNASAVNLAYGELRGKTPPTHTLQQRQRVKNARHRAAQNGWDGFMTEFLRAA